MWVLLYPFGGKWYVWILVQIHSLGSYEGRVGGLMAVLLMLYISVCVCMCVCVHVCVCIYGNMYMKVE